MNEHDLNTTHPAKKRKLLKPLSNFYGSTVVDQQHENRLYRRAAELTEQKVASVTQNALRSSQIAKFLMESGYDAHDANTILAENERMEGGKQAEIYKEFDKQQQMFDYADSLQPSIPRSALHFFSREAPRTGKRSFIVATLGRFWENYTLVPEEERHFYELIREGSPCHLYLDLEYARVGNEGYDGLGNVKRFVELLLTSLKARFPTIPEVQGLTLARDVLELDSSSDKKFSRHVLIRIPHHAFASNAHVGAFVRHVVESELADAERRKTQVQPEDREGMPPPPVPSQQQPPPHKSQDLPRPHLQHSQVHSSCASVSLAASNDVVHGGEGADRGAGVSSALQELHWLQVYKEGGPEAGTSLLVDLGVYSRNRTFRLYLSSKANKAAHLVPTHRFLGKSFYDPRDISSVRTRPHRECFEKALVCGPDTRSNPLLAVKLLTTFDEAAEGGQQQPRRVGGGRVGGGGGGGGGRAKEGPTPFPSLERFICHVSDPDAHPGTSATAAVRSWLYERDVGVMVLNMKGTRYCNNKGAQHRSNGVYYIVDLRGGYFYQKCHDPECRAYRSALMPLPEDVAASINEQLGKESTDAAGDQAAQAMTEDEIYLQALEQFEAAGGLAGVEGTGTAQAE